ncbi:M23 family metallopeptidase [Flavobacterium sp. TSSA_36]|uniref:M23 family metallopeptidase n=1 Tax=Flavobacterium sp. TSSA_36 TaxID=3447669 RepID=UPI003F3C6A08
MKFYCFLLFLGITLTAQNQYPKDYFRAPLDIPMQLFGNFGELRPNHFHAGWDYKTQQREGLPVYAAAEGYISRIKISTFGNGKTIYITHPNGFTTVYAHLQKAVGTIQELIKKRQYDEKSFEVEIFLRPNEVPITKGQLIALSGNTGASEGPHLHFEIRDSQTEFVINALFFGFDTLLKDSKKPQVTAVYAYPLDDKTIVNQSLRPIPINLILQKDGTYLADPVMANGRIGFGIVATDMDDVSFNKNGIFEVQAFYNGTPTYAYQFGTYSFDEMRYINVLIDYAKYKKSQQRIQRLFRTAPFDLSIVKTDASNGIISVVPNLTGTYRIEVADFFKNKTIISIPIIYDVKSGVIPKEATPANYFIKAQKEYIFEKENWTVTFPANTFYNDFELNFAVANKVLTLHDDTVPVHANFTIQVQDSTHTTFEKEKMFLGRIEGGRISYNPTVVKENIFSARVKTLGKYGLVLDNVNPVITIAKPIEGKWITSQKELKLSIYDALSGIKSYNAFLNDQWILMEYDNKTRQLTHDFSDGIVAEGANILKVVVVDQMGNSTTFETRFFRSQILK